MTPPPCVPILRAKLNFSLKWGMWPVAEMVPQSGQKAGPPPTHQSGVRGCWPQESFKYVFHLWQGPTWCARRRRTSARIPEGSRLAVRLNTSPSEVEEMQRIGKRWIHHWHLHPQITLGFPMEQMLRRDIWLMSAPCISSKPFSESRKQKENQVKFTKLTDPSTQECENRHHSRTVHVWHLHPFHATGQPYLHISYHFTPSTKELSKENFNMRYYNNARVPPPFHLPTQIKRISPQLIWESDGI